MNDDDRNESDLRTNKQESSKFLSVQQNEERRTISAMEKVKLRREEW
jgi:hypothetical protein